MADQPEFPPYIGVTDVSTLSHDNMVVEAFMRGQHSIMADEPAGFNIPWMSSGDDVAIRGQNRGWTPVHYQLAGLAMCTSITIAVVAHDQSFSYRDLRTSIRSLIDIRGFCFDLDLQPKFEQVNFDLTLDTDAPVGAIEALARESDRRCPQLQVFHLAGIPLRMRWFRLGAADPVLVQRFFIEDEEPEARLRAAAAAV